MELRKAPPIVQPAMDTPCLTPIDDYISQVPSAEFQGALRHVRAIVRDRTPDADEVISYGIPAMKLGEPVVWFAAFANHCSLYAGHIVADFAHELEGYRMSKGTIQFTPDRPIPDAVVRSIVEARLAAIAEKRGRKRRAPGKTSQPLGA